MANGGLEVGRERLRLHHGANLGTHLGQSAHIFGIERLQLGVDAVVQAIGFKEFAKRVGRGGKSSGHAHALGQLRNHLAQAGVFTANGLDILHTQLFKRHDQSRGAEPLRHEKLHQV